MKEDLIDEYIITVVPTLLVEVFPFDNEKPEIDIKLLEVKQYDSGIVQLHYGKFPK